MTDFCALPSLDIRLFWPNLDHPTPPTADDFDVQQAYLDARNGAVVYKGYGGLIVPAKDTVGTAGEAWAALDNLYFDLATQAWLRIDNNAVPLKIAPLRGVALAAAASASKNNIIRIEGLVIGYSGLTPGGRIYASGTPGGYTQTRPAVSAGGGQVAISEMGHALSASAAWISPQPVYYLKRESLANNGTLTITHHSDPLPYVRKTQANSLTTVTILPETVASANQDTDIYLKGLTGAGNTVTVDTAGASSFTLGDITGTDWKVAQSFTTPNAGFLTSFTVRFGSTTGTPSAAPTWSIRADNAGNPAVGTLATGSTGAITANSDKTVTLPTPVYLQTGTTYWLVLELPVQASNNAYSVLYNGANPYASGGMKADSTTTSFPNTWTATAAGKDLRCSFVVVGVISGDRLAQGVSRNRTTIVPSLRLWLKRVGTLSDTLTAALFDDVSGHPGSVIANGTATAAASSVGTSYGWIDFVFSTPPTLAANVQYHIVLSTSGSSSITNYIVWGADSSSPPYANGTLETETASVWSNAAADACFELYAYDTYTEPLVIGRYASGAHIGVRFDDGAEASTDTATTFKNTSGGTLDVTCQVYFAEAS